MKENNNWEKFIGLIAAIGFSIVSFIFHSFSSYAVTILCRKIIRGVHVHNLACSRGGMY